MKYQKIRNFVGERIRGQLECRMYISEVEWHDIEVEKSVNKIYEVIYSTFELKTFEQSLKISSLRILRFSYEDMRLLFSHSLANECRLRKIIDISYVQISWFAVRFNLEGG